MSIRFLLVNLQTFQVEWESSTFLLPLIARSLKTNDAITIKLVISGTGNPKSLDF